MKPTLQAHIQSAFASFFPWKFDYASRHKWFHSLFTKFFRYKPVDSKRPISETCYSEFFFCQMFLQVLFSKEYNDISNYCFEFSVTVNDIVIYVAFLSAFLVYASSFMLNFILGSSWTSKNIRLPFLLF